METRPISPETWAKLPPEVQAYILFLEHALRQSLERIAQLEQRVSELEARLNRHSGNSSLPPSQDPPQAPRNRKEKSGRKPGGQKGHQGNHRELAPPEKVNKIVEHRAEECPHCRSALDHAAARQAPPVERRQVWELPEIQPVITEHRLSPAGVTIVRPG